MKINFLLISIMVIALSVFLFRNWHKAEGNVGSCPKTVSNPTGDCEKHENSEDHVWYMSLMQFSPQYKSTVCFIDYEEHKRCRKDGGLYAGWGCGLTPEMKNYDKWVELLNKRNAEIDPAKLTLGFDNLPPVYEVVMGYTAQWKQMRKVWLIYGEDNTYFFALRDDYTKKPIRDVIYWRSIN